VGELCLGQELDGAHPVALALGPERGLYCSHHQSRSLSEVLDDRFVDRWLARPATQLAVLRATEAAFLVQSEGTLRAALALFCGDGRNHFTSRATFLTLMPLLLHARDASSHPSVGLLRVLPELVEQLLAAAFP
jgi:hypothetical protein